MFVLKPWIMFADDGAEAGGSQEEHEENASDQEVEADADADGEEDSQGSESWDADRARAKIAKANAEAKALRERAKTAEQKAASAEDTARENADLKAQLLRAQVALEVGLPPALASRLQGGTREEIVADADALIKLVAPKAPGSRKPSNRVGEGHEKGVPEALDDLDKIAAGFMND